MSDGRGDAINSHKWDMSRVLPGRVYRHFKGNLYAVIGVGADNEDRHNEDKKKVLYMDMDNGTVSHISLSEFTELVEPVSNLGIKSMSKFSYVGIDVLISIDERGRYNVTRQY